MISSFWWVLWTQFIYFLKDNKLELISINTQFINIRIISSSWWVLWTQFASTQHPEHLQVRSKRETISSHVEYNSIFYHSTRKVYLCTLFYLLCFGKNILPLILICIVKILRIIKLSWQPQPFVLLWIN